MNDEIIVHNLLDLRCGDTIRATYVTRDFSGVDITDIFFGVIVEMSTKQICAKTIYMNSDRMSDILYHKDSFVMNINSTLHSTRTVCILDRPGKEISQNDFTDEL